MLERGRRPTLAQRPHTECPCLDAEMAPWEQELASRTGDLSSALKPYVAEVLIPQLTFNLAHVLYFRGPSRMSSGCRMVRLAGSTPLSTFAGFRASQQNRTFNIIYRLGGTHRR